MCPSEIFIPNIIHVWPVPHRAMVHKAVFMSFQNGNHFSLLGQFQSNISCVVIKDVYRRHLHHTSSFTAYYWFCNPHSKTDVFASVGLPLCLTFFLRIQSTLYAQQRNNYLYSYSQIKIHYYMNCIVNIELNRHRVKHTEIIHEDKKI